MHVHIVFGIMFLRFHNVLKPDYRFWSEFPNQVASQVLPSAAMPCITVDQGVAYILNLIF